jgi:hypothetical protein
MMQPLHFWQAMQEQQVFAQRIPNNDHFDQNERLWVCQYNRMSVLATNGCFPTILQHARLPA